MQSLHVHENRVTCAAWAAGLCALAATLYLASGVAHAYLAEDDFTWLLGGLAFSWSQLDFAGRTHFFRPVINLWFGGLTDVCGPAAGCYHVADLTVHLVNVALVFRLALGLSRRLLTAVLATLLFVVLPGYAQTVVWVSAITGLLATTWFLVSLALQLDAIGRGIGRSPRLWGAVAAFALAVFSHEGTATLPIVAVLLHWWFSPDRRMPRTLAAGFAAVLALFAVTTLTANRHNYVFTQDHYAIGFHMVRSALDYGAALYVGPHTWPAYVVSVVVLATVFFCDRTTRFGAAWLLVTLVPFLGFTWGNAGRYLYLPSIGFSLAVAGALSMATDWLSHRLGRRGALAVIVGITTIVSIRFGVFAVRAIRSQVNWLDATRAYVEEVQGVQSSSADGVLTIPAPTDPLVNADYAEPMLRWARQDPTVRVTVAPTRTPR